MARIPTGLFPLCDIRADSFGLDFSVAVTSHLRHRSRGAFCTGVWNPAEDRAISRASALWPRPRKERSRGLSDRSATPGGQALLTHCDAPAAAPTPARFSR